MLYSCVRARAVCALLLVGCAGDVATRDSDDTDDSDAPAPDPGLIRPASLRVGVWFAWDASEHQVAVVTYPEGTVPPLVQVQLASSAEAQAGDPEVCVASYVVDLQPVESPGPADGVRLVVEGTARSVYGLDGCDGWDLSILGDDPTAHHWRIELTEHIDPALMISPLDYDFVLGATVEGPAFFGARSAAALAFAVDEGMRPILENGQPVPMDRHAMFDGDSLSDGYYSPRMPSFVPPQL